MFRQIKIHEEDWRFQRILWVTSDDELLTYQLITVTYGLACAPFLALRTILQLAENEGDKFPLAVEPLLKGRYVDDIFGGADSEDQVQEIVAQLNQLCTAGDFPLQKWVNNKPEVLQSIPIEKRIDSTLVPIESDIIVHILGLCWLRVLTPFNSH